MRWAALWRAVNVGKRTVASAELRRFLADQGLTDGRTLLASGNAVFASEEEEPSLLEARLDAAFKHRFGFAAEVLLRDAAALDRVIAANPFGEAARDRPNRLLVTFYRVAPTPAQVEELARLSAAGEPLALAADALFVDHGQGVATSRLPQLMTKLRFPPVATARNWNTVCKLRAALAEAGA